MYRTWPRSSSRSGGAPSCGTRVEHANAMGSELVSAICGEVRLNKGSLFFLPEKRQVYHSQNPLLPMSQSQSGQKAWGVRYVKRPAPSCLRVGRRQDSQGDRHVLAASDLWSCGIVIYAARLALFGVLDATRAPCVNLNGGSLGCHLQGFMSNHL